MTNKLRLEFEMKLCAEVIDCLLKAGFSITANDGEDDYLVKCSDKEKILKEVNSTCEDIFYAIKDGKEFGWVSFIWGNADALISDYTINLEEIIKPANDFAETYLTGWN